MHVLLGDVFREKRRWEEAETEYRRAIALDPKGRSARLSLAITLYSELKNDEAFALTESLLSEDPGNPEANLLAGEILVQGNQFAQAESYLLKRAGLQPELLLRSHVLLGKVYAETGRVPQAIAEYKLGLSTDQDGSVHYQLARLYQQSGNKIAAEEAFKESKRLVTRWHDRARVVLEQMGTDVSRQ
jgi:predicted Zn-dependent protease